MHSYVQKWLDKTLEHTDTKRAGFHGCYGPSDDSMESSFEHKQPLKQSQKVFPQVQLNDFLLTAFSTADFFLHYKN